ncbi:hypothetical protein A3B40_01410 [Candidatus Roizmanbacteria bacterium RIFCSPLOWO2_01_FULL_37_16]|uniref:Uncharacterized protein n=1 Tax=Candidatus Roizmanbacteria bacterium RIFCSPLOWO2_01_FULL_37_16 TaxID=1802058 RepID=A0A1F7IJ96_9BACT|nr:MAG: hypothetical protein A3B40_01410 [Candidatus Roizmanbacteria bacterium RIFCSPLOWO2_01_FULL_37_16]
MKDQNRGFDYFLQTISRATIIIPIIIVVLAILFKLTDAGVQQKSFLEYNLKPTPTQTQIRDGLNVFKKATGSAKFNLTGPLHCSFSTDTAVLSADIRDKKIYLKVDEKKEIQNYLLSGDCLYIWKQGSYSGEKICGISKQVAMIEGLLSSNILDPNFIFSNLNRVLPIPSVGKSKNPLSSLLNSCSKGEAPTPSLFEIPKNILFKNKTTYK